MSGLSGKKPCQLLDGVRVQLATGLCIILTVVLFSWTNMTRNEVAYKSYWIEVKEDDLDKPAMATNIAVIRYHLRITHAKYLEERLNSQTQITNRQLLEYINEVALIYSEYKAAQHPRQGVLNPS